MFNSIFTRGAPSQSPAPAQQPQQPQQAPTQQQQVPQGQQQPAVAPSETLRMPAQQQQPQQPPSPSVMDVIGRMAMNGQPPQNQQPTQPVAPSADPAQFASDFIAAMLNAPEMPATPSAPRINPTALREAFGAVDLTTGLDIGQLTEALQGRAGQDVDPSALTRTALQTQGLNIIEAVVPVLNQMVEQAMQRAIQASTQQTTHGLTSSSLVQEFVSLHPYARSPMMLNMVTQFCNAIVAQNPSNINRGEIFKAIDLVFQGMSQAVRPNQSPGQELVPSNAQTGFSNLFAQ